ncbi:hypothetical protein [Flammeovirga sp. SJP92]|uniref:hypothetical protein n=1 Tax=Flammeovirga sp. SJP92 TaxID=1775430 RepID=UPI00078699DB|nr:hypothetical protein [Flammeovirga sp. SJP92]KXX67803.1 hypothetical protein AVL50_25410 [Flammeovirga sp. SJP92]
MERLFNSLLLVIFILSGCNECLDREDLKTKFEKANDQGKDQLDTVYINFNDGRFKIIPYKKSNDVVGRIYQRKDFWFILVNDSGEVLINDQTYNSLNDVKIWKDYYDTKSKYYYEGKRRFHLFYDNKTCNYLELLEEGFHKLDKDSVLEDPQFFIDFRDI